MPESTEQDTNTQEQPITGKKEKTTLYFSLAENKIRYETPDGIVKLNRLEGKVNGHVTSEDPVAFRMVQNAFMAGTLVHSKKKLDESDQGKPEMVDVTNFAESKSKIRGEASSYLRKLKKPELIERISQIKNPQLIAMMMEQESHGRNVSKRKREDIYEALDTRLKYIQRTAKASTMVAFSEDTKEGYAVKHEYDPQI